MTKEQANELLAEALSHDEPTKARKLYELVNGIFDDIGNRMDRREAIQLAMEETLFMKREDYDVVMELVNKIYAGTEELHINLPNPSAYEIRENSLVNRIGRCEECEYYISMMRTPLEHSRLYCTEHRVHIPILPGINCSSFKRRQDG